MAFIVIILILAGITTSASTTTATNSTKLELLHRERNGNYSHWFQQRMKRDAKRVAYLMNHMEQVDFVGEVVSGVNEGVGEYIIPIEIGSPPIAQHVIMDTGSDLIWVQCQKCQQCHSQFDPIFDPARSSSYTEIPCESSACDRLNGKQDCDREGSCSYRASYADVSESKGTLVFETIVFGDVRILNMAIGCGYMNKGTFGHQAGIMGLGAGPLSLVYEIPVGGFFSYCLPSRDSQVSGSLVIGKEAISTGSVWVPLLSSIKNPSFYYVRMIGLGVGGIRLPISEDIFHLTESGDGGVIIDSGTTVSRFPKVAYEAFRDAFIAQTMDIPRAPGVDLFDTCFNLPNTIDMPLVSFHFWSDIGEVSLVIPPRNFLVVVDNMRTACFAFAPSPASFSIIGNIQQEQIKISYNTVGGTLGFGPDLCM
ncbi:protein ASPARTIC PROTEASE IN GUARD CELL 2-like [Quercus lobata]|uniref:protein ASPARTIC PROTEASE IN GUARD CELL 2-like n=1 Tax=Quercus lobata TaxID=97700 RepID=UPI0012468ACF|nr:protein ASPARTIC PROTEASE IN GUARD CELL 2-like [Quercus lobata]